MEFDQLNIYDMNIVLLIGPVHVCTLNIMMYSMLYTGTDGAVISKKKKKHLVITINIYIIDLNARIFN